MSWQDPGGQKWKNLTTIGKLTSSLSFVTGIGCLFSTLVWVNGTGGAWLDGFPASSLSNQIGHGTIWISSANLILSLLVIGFYHKPRGWVGLAGSGIALLLLLTASTKVS